MILLKMQLLRVLMLLAKYKLDFANQREKYNYQKFAAFTSCEYVKLIYEKNCRIMPDYRTAPE